MWESTVLGDSRIVTGQPFDDPSKPTTSVGFRYISVSLSDENGKHHQTYKFDHFGSKKTEDDTCFGGFGSAILIPDEVIVSKPAGPDRFFFKCRVFYLGSDYPRFTLEEKTLAESYNP